MNRLLLVVFLLSSVGCISRDTTVEVVYELEEEDFLVVLPFKEPEYRTRWNSPNGLELMDKTTRILSNLAEFGVRPTDDVLGLFMSEEDVARLGTRDVADLCGADYVLECDLVRWDPLADKNVGIAQGTAKVHVRLFKVVQRPSKEEDTLSAKAEEANRGRRKVGMAPLVHARGGKYVYEDMIEVRYPDTFIDQYGVMMTDEEARVGLLGATSRRVAELLYEHDEPHRMSGRR